MFHHSTLRGWPLPLALAAFLAVTARPAAAQIIDSIPTYTPNSTPTQTATDPRDGTLWFVEETGNRIGTITPSRTFIIEVNLVIPGSRPTAIAVDNQGRAWFAMAGTNKIGVYTRPTNSLVEYQLPAGTFGLAGISVDSQGQVWFTEKFTNRIGVLNPSTLQVQYISSGSNNLGLQDIVCDDFGRGWFTQQQSNQIGYIDLSFPQQPKWYNYQGQIQGPYGIDVGFNNDIWFTEQTGGWVTSLQPQSGNMFAFDTWNGRQSQPRYVDAFQTQQGQYWVSWTEPTPQNSLIGLLSPTTGKQTQIQATTQSAQPTGVSYGYDQSLWWTETANSNLTGWFLNTSIVSRLPGVGDPILASLTAPMPSADGPRTMLANEPGSRPGSGLKLASLQEVPVKVRTVGVKAKASRVKDGKLVPASLDEADAPRIILTQGPTIPTTRPGTGFQKQAQIGEQTAILDVIQVTQTQVSPTKIERQVATSGRMAVAALNGQFYTGPSKDQIFVKPGDCLTLAFIIKFSAGAYGDFAIDPNTTFTAELGQFTAKNVWCARPQDGNKSFTLYGQHRLPTGEVVNSRLVIKISPGTGGNPGTNPGIVSPGTPDPNDPIRAVRMFVTAVNGVPTTGNPTQVQINAGQCVTIAFQATTRSGAVIDLTTNPGTNMFSEGGVGTFVQKNLWCSNATLIGRRVRLFGQLNLPGVGALNGNASVLVQ